MKTYSKKNLRTAEWQQREKQRIANEIARAGRKAKAVAPTQEWLDKLDNVKPFTFAFGKKK